MKQLSKSAAIALAAIIILGGSFSQAADSQSVTSNESSGVVKTYKTPSDNSVFGKDIQILKAKAGNDLYQKVKSISKSSMQERAFLNLAVLIKDMTTVNVNKKDKMQAIADNVLRAVTCANQSLQVEKDQRSVGQIVDSVKAFVITSDAIAKKYRNYEEKSQVYPVVDNYDQIDCSKSLVK